MDRRTTGSRQPPSLNKGAGSGTPLPVLIVGLAAAAIVGLFVVRQLTRAPAPEAAPVRQQPPHFEPRHSAQRQAAPADSFDDAPSGMPSAMAHGPRKNPLRARAPSDRVAPGGVAENAAEHRLERGAAAVAEPGVESLKAAEVVGTPGQAPALSVSFNGSANGADDSTPIIAQGVDFDPNLGAGRFPPNAHLAYPDRGGLDPNEGSVVFWVRMEWDPTLPIEGKSLVQMRTNAWENRFELRVAPKWIGLLLTTSDGIEQGVGTALYWAKDEWHHVGAVWGQQIMQFYVDGSLRDERDYAGSVVLPPGTPLYIGSQQGPKESQGTVSMRSLSTFTRMLSGDEIAELMVGSAPAS